MKDWPSIAKAAAPDIPAKEVSRYSQTLDSLEEIFRPLADSLTPEMEPACVFGAGQEQA
ncbi:MAG TPA: hypothetical protein VMB03_28940 [Bryobacteraceae bacterium]|nr:hypothetical protein [Bryobacteraceae bacterium]